MHLICSIVACEEEGHDCFNELWGDLLDLCERCCLDNHKIVPRRALCLRRTRGSVAHDVFAVWRFGLLDNTGKMGGLYAARQCVHMRVKTCALCCDVGMFDKMLHVWPVHATGSPQSTRARECARATLRRCVGREDSLPAFVNPALLDAH